MNDTSSTLFAFFILLSSITFISTVLRRFRLPTLVGFIGTGLVIGPSGLDWIDSIPVANTISEWGVMFLLFSLGLEIPVAQLRKMFRPLFTLGLGQVAATACLGACVFYFGLGISNTKSILFGCLLALSSTAVILKSLNDTRENETPFGRVCITILLFQDLAALLMIMFLPMLSLGAADSSIGRGFLLVLKMVAAVVGIILVGRFIIPKIFEEVVGTGSRELFFFLIMSVTLGIALVAERSGLSLSIGAFLAGVVISESPYSKQALAELSLMRDNFLGLFFASFGMLVDLGFILGNASTLILWVLGLFLLKATVVYGAIRLNRKPHGVALSTALSLAQIGEFSFILAAVALKNRLMNEFEFQYFLSLAVLSLLASPLLFYWARRVSAHSGWKVIMQGVDKTVRSQEASVAAASDHPGPAIVIGLGHAGHNVMDSLKSLEIPFCGIDFNSATIRRLKADGFPVLFGDASRDEILQAAGIEKAYLIIVTVTGKNLTGKILSTIRKIRPGVPVIVRTQYILDLEDLAIDKNDRVVVAEFETAREILAKVLIAYDVLPAKIHSILERCDAKMRDLLSGMQSDSHQLQGPYWKALAAIRLLPVLAVNQASSRLEDLSIRKRTGCNIAAIYRSGVGLEFPDGNSEVQVGDVLYAIGHREALDALAALVDSGFAV